MLDGHSFASPPVGFLILDKPLCMTSMQAVAAVRRRAGGKGIRTGHAGTLDPLATGVLVVAIGRAATRIIDMVQSLPKRYLTTIDLSAFTTTDDREGTRTEVPLTDAPQRERIERTLREQFIGEVRQTPPAYSAVKVSGRRAYRLARAQGSGEGAKSSLEAVEEGMQARMIRIDSIGIVSYEWPLLTLDIRCGKGTYIRRLARDLGIALGTGGHCAWLRRTAIGPFTDSRAIALADLPEVLGQDDVLSIDDVRASIEGT